MPASRDDRLTPLVSDTPEYDTPEYDTLDEAIAAALASIDPGGVLTIHAEDCQSDDGEEGCTCEPLEMTVGAKA